MNKSDLVALKQAVMDLQAEQDGLQSGRPQNSNAATEVDFEIATVDIARRLAGAQEKYRVAVENYFVEKSAAVKK